MAVRNEIEVVTHNNMDFLDIFIVQISSRMPHAHDDLEIGLILKGNLYIYVISRYQIHSLSSEDGSNQVLVFQISSRFYSNISPKIKRIRFTSPLIDTGELSDRFRNTLLKCAEAYYSGDDFGNIACAAITYDIIYKLCSSHPNTVLTDVDFSRSRHNSMRVNRITEYIAENYREKISLHDLAEQENVSEFYLSHLIKDTMGISFQECVNHFRFEHALRLMNTSSDVSITDVYMDAGFSSSRYLNQEFMKRIGMTAREYLKCSKRILPATNELPTDNVQVRLSEDQTCSILEKRIVITKP